MSAQLLLQGRKLKYPVEEKTVGQYFFNRCRKYSDCICQIDGTEDKSETYGSVNLRSIRVAIELQKRRITPNDVITVCSPNTLDNVIPLVATLYIGAKISNLDASLSVRHVKHLLNIVTPKMIFVEEQSVKLIEDALEDAEFQTEIVIFGNSEKYSTFSDFTKPQKNEENFVTADVDSEKADLIFFSSGSTGLPKAICHSHKNFFVIISQTRQSGWDTDILHFSSFYWITATMILLTCSSVGTSRVFYRNPTAENILEMIEKYKIKCLLVLPNLSYKLTQYANAAKYDTSSVKICSISGSPIATSQIEKLKILFKQAKTNSLYGMTETGFISTFDPEFDQELSKRKLASCGKTAAGITLKIVDIDTGLTFGANQKGEICFTSPSLMKGYYKADSSQLLDEDGFLKTGDVGYYDEDECLYVVERIKEMFKYQCYQISPSAIEIVLLEHPAIKEVLVFGVPHVEDGELPAALVVLKESRTLGEEEIDQFLKERVADRERLRGGVTFVENLPRTATGKIARNQVRNFALNFKTKSD